ncbi:uncharacterized protein EV422DRAFT_623645 [Fimicolochytrium jonesii]|uniref:uncharacterized protein n=1 Tax=Fimicolochytrium jonesii TaxID=1396493 RepID=UPI0022FDCFE7|nr:uncharacterized protein EV422DRAFT_623645 [Fimicolochytrium jonesii]KAI8816139.1 hypothetical protein EV422DRAFT_623645 [Fimicolochytrium jonesii]
MTADLAKINQKILPQGHSFTAVTLADGTQVQTGTVATLLHNVRLYDALPADATDERRKLEEEMRAAAPTLDRIGLFDLFTPAEWMAGSSAARRLVGGFAKDLRAKEGMAA